MTPLATYDVCGVRIAVATVPVAAQHIAETAAQRRALDVHLCNAYTLSLVDQDERLRTALRKADLNLPDGTPVAWLGRGSGAHGPVRGPSLVRQVAEAGLPYGLRHYFYGGAPGVAEQLAVRLTQDLPGLQIAGWESPAFGEPGPKALDGVAERLDTFKAHVVWVGLGTPRQDYVVPLLTKRVPIAAVPVGAAFDFLTGRVKEAPRYLQGSGLEWVYRLGSDPRRLWARYLIGNPRFVASAVRHLVS